MERAGERCGRVLEIDLADEQSSSVSESWSDMRRMDSSCSRTSLVDVLEQRTQRTYRYGIGLVCIGATLNWLGFAQGQGYVDPLRYLGVACVVSGSFCVCMAMCRWFGKPLAISYNSRMHRQQQEERPNCHRHNGDVHVINVSVPISSNPTQCPQKPPDYETVLSSQPPSYDEAIKLAPYPLATLSVPHLEKSASDISMNSSIHPPDLQAEQIMGADAPPQWCSEQCIGVSDAKELEKQVCCEEVLTSVRTELPLSS